MKKIIILWIFVFLLIGLHKAQSQHPWVQTAEFELDQLMDKKYKTMDDFKDFDHRHSTMIHIGGDLVEQIEVEKGGGDLSYDWSEKTIHLPTHGNAIIYFTNGHKMLITNSEWAAIQLLP